MKPIKGLLQFAIWLMRLSIAFFVFITFFNDMKTFNFKSIQFYIAIAFIIFGFLLFIGGFLNKQGITVFSGFMLFFASVYKIFILFYAGISSELAMYSIIATTSLYFITAGNKN